MTDKTYIGHNGKKQLVFYFIFHRNLVYQSEEEVGSAGEHPINNRIDVRQ